ncbi:MAG TPA: metallophosphoesterase [Kofleriaceae bacterium]|nr:metallophosphoesterase [Kofleriaceae bacterium]
MSCSYVARVFVIVTLFACQTNQSGHLAAVKSGSGVPPAVRGSPVDALRASCGDGALLDAGTRMLMRQPYLQQITTTSAMFGWVSTAAEELRVDVTTPDRQIVATATAVPQVGSLRPPGEYQMWATATGLGPDAIYCYTLWSGAEQLTASTGFRTAPAADSAAPVRFLAFGDSGGGGADQYALRDQMYTVPYDLMVHTGDLAYDNGTIAQLDDNVFGVYADLLRNLGLFPSAGNHEYDTMRGAPFREVFALPEVGGEKWYSFDWGRAHFAALDTEADYATQAAWLDRDLAATAAGWKIVYLHKPPYSSGTHGSDTALRSVLAPVLERHQVQLVLAGHDHDYERITPQGGVTYVVTGGGGIGTRSVGSSSFTAFSEDVIHFVYGEIGSDELILHAIDGTGSEFDSVAIPR